MNTGVVRRGVWIGEIGSCVDNGMVINDGGIS